LLLVELGLAGAVEMAGGLAKLLVGEIVERLVGGDVAGAESVTVKGPRDTGAQGVVLVDACLEGQPCGLLAGGDDFSVPLAGRLTEESEKEVMEGGHAVTVPGGWCQAAATEVRLPCLLRWSAPLALRRMRTGSNWSTSRGGRPDCPS